MRPENIARRDLRHYAMPSCARVTAIALRTKMPLRRRITGYDATAA